MRAIAAASVPHSAHRFVWVVCSLWLVLAVDHALLLPPLFPLDDAYIAMHNATALRTGVDPNFGGVSALYGSTSLIHLLLVALAQCFVPAAWASWAVTWLGALLLLTGTSRLARVAGLHWYAEALLVALSLLAADSMFQLLNGIETGLAMAAVVWAFALRSARSSWLLPGLLGLLPLVRPELALLSGVLWLERGLRAPAPERIRQLARDAGIALIPLAPGLIAYLATTGAPLPQTLTVKRDFFTLTCAGMAFHLSWFARGVGAFLERANLVALGLVCLCVRPVQWSALGFAAALLAATAIAFPEGVGHNYYRYLYVLLPLCSVGFVHAWSVLGGRKRQVLVAAIGCALVGSLAGVPRTLMTYLGDLNQTETEIEPAAEFVRRQLPADTPLLAHDIGFISTAVPNPIIDVVGLKDPRAAALQRSITASRCERDTRARVVSQLAIERNARHFVVFAEWDKTFQFTAGLRNLGWTLTPLRSPDAVYQVYQLARPERLR